MGSFSFSSALIKSVPLIVLGIWTFLHLNSAAGPFVNPIIEQCSADAKNVTVPGIAVVDDLVRGGNVFICFVVPFFKASLETPEGILIWGSLLALAQPFAAFLGVEGSRVGAVAPLTLVPVFLLLMAIIGISVITPLMYLPAYFFFAYRDRSPQSASKTEISTTRAAVIGLLQYLQLLPLLGMLFKFDTETLETIIIVVQVAPVVIPLLWLPFSSKDPKSATRGHYAVIAVQLMNAGMGALWHLISILWALQHAGSMTAILGLFEDKSGFKACQYFLLVDGLVFFLSLLYHVAVEDGVGILLATLFGSVLLGPGGAFGLYYAYRESQLLKAHSVSVVKKKK